jgi:hypothetical protein
MFLSQEDSNITCEMATIIAEWLILIVVWSRLKKILCDTDNDKF